MATINYRPGDDVTYCGSGWSVESVAEDGFVTINQVREYSDGVSICVATVRAEVLS